jgi:hypothetical protein
LVSSSDFEVLARFAWEILSWIVVASARAIAVTCEVIKDWRDWIFSSKEIFSSVSRVWVSREALLRSDSSWVVDNCCSIRDWKALLFSRSLDVTSSIFKERNLVSDLRDSSEDEDVMIFWFRVAMSLASDVDLRADSVKAASLNTITASSAPTSLSLDSTSSF